MPIDIRPFSESNSDASSPAFNSEARAKEFMDTLRARVETQDEAQKETWAKATKPEPKRKPVTPGNPGWMNAAKPAKEKATTTPTLQSRSKKKRPNQS